MPCARRPAQLALPWYQAPSGVSQGTSKLRGHTHGPWNLTPHSPGCPAPPARPARPPAAPARCCSPAPPSPGRSVRRRSRRWGRPAGAQPCRQQRVGVPRGCVWCGGTLSSSSLKFYWWVVKSVGWWAHKATGGLGRGRTHSVHVGRQGAFRGCSREGGTHPIGAALERGCT